TAGTFDVTFFKNGYELKTVEAVSLENGVKTILDVQLFPPGTNGTNWLEAAEVNLKISPNVFSGQANISFDLPTSFDNAELRVANAVGQTVWTRKVEKNTTSMVFDAELPSGAYYLSLHLDGQQTKAIKLTKLD
ncbi:MAG: T9SS type A sorting domain-containing protein, partial [Saprospiraceae bacterium]|nr:T9SS type A sorting domain-containing protein [Saprospiraceae bacterium]